MAHNISIIYGSVREHRQGIKAARFFEKQINDRGHKTILIDPKDFDLPMLNKMYKEYKGQAPEKMEKLAEILRHSDGYLIVSGEYNHSMTSELQYLHEHSRR